MRLMKKVGPQPAVLSGEDIAHLVATMVDAAVEARVADEVERVRADLIKLIPEWVRRSADFPMTHEAIGRRFAAEYGEHYRFGVFGDDPTPHWYRPAGVTRWTTDDTARHLRDAWKNLRGRLLIESDQDCIPPEGAKRRHFIEKQCNTALDLDLILESASRHVKAPD